MALILWLCGCKMRAIPKLLLSSLAGIILVAILSPFIGFNTIRIACLLVGVFGVFGIVFIFFGV